MDVADKSGNLKARRGFDNTNKYLLTCPWRKQRTPADVLFLKSWMAFMALKMQYEYMCNRAQILSLVKETDCLVRRKGFCLNKLF